MPPEPGHDYLVIGDIGQGRPPYRNSPCVMVFDVSGYPHAPAVLRAFWWGDGQGSYAPWIAQFKSWMTIYHVKAAGYDATGGQKAHSEMTFEGNALVTPIDMSGVKKKLYINILKLMFQKERVRLPRNIPGLTTQFGKYRLPDDKLAQDIVATGLVLAGLMWSLGIDDELNDVAEMDPAQSHPMHRQSRLSIRRHGGHARRGGRS
jgi:hypothetical protein